LTKNVKSYINSSIMLDVDILVGKSILSYFNELNRGGLSYRSSILLYAFNLLMQF